MTPDTLAFRRVTSALLALILLTVGLGIIRRHAIEDSAASVQLAAVPERIAASNRAIFDAAAVFGRFGCGDLALAELVAQRANESGLPPRLLAAMIAVESSCNPYAISKAGAVGLMQIHLKTWSGEYNFQQINLFDPTENTRVGAEILKRMIAQHGLERAVERYCGQGPDARAYAKKVMEVMR